jgi:hypothetical protein
MPGLFSPDHVNSRASSRLELFAPAPRLASTSETSGRLVDSGGHEARKRSRNNNLNTETPRSRAPPSHSWTNAPLAYSHFPDARSPPPLANDRYELAGGMERSGFGGHNGDHDDYFQLQHQRGMWSAPATPVVGLQDHDRTPVNAVLSTPNDTKPWVFNQLLSIVGGVAGKLVQFCAVPFRGFSAGGGQAYTITSHGGIEATDGQVDLFTGSSEAYGLPAAIFPEEDYGVRSLDSVSSERPRAKRLRTGENWVVVDQDGGMDSRPGTPRLSERRVPNHTKSPSQIPRPVSRAAGSTVNTTPKRPSLIPVSRRSTLDGRSFRQATTIPSNSYTSPRSYGRQIYGSPSVFRNSDSIPPALSPESQHLVNKLRSEEIEEDDRMRRMSSQMDAMLREARQALGSKYEVEDDYGGMTK